MEVAQVLHMNGGLGDTSYANNSSLQRKVMSMTKGITEETITELYINMVPSNDVVCIADLGCSSGPNTFFAVAELVKIVDRLRRKLGRNSPDYQINLNDLPGTDFNSIFQSFLPRFQAELRQETGPGFGQCLVSGVPGTFYGRLFAAKTLHFVHSSYSLMWLSKVPDGVEMNKENIYMTRTSPQSVIDAYYEQFHRDFSNFLKCRSEEVVSNGKMVLTLLGRKVDDASSKECCYIWELLSVALQEMVSEGLIEEEKLHSFHIPQYTPSTKEVASEIQKEGSFIINRLEASEITWAACSSFYSQDSIEHDDGYNVAKCMRSVAEPLLAKHFGDLVIDQLFDKYKKILSDRMSKEDTKFINATVSMTRR
ncbi:Salicylate carboxymethyltransferase [Handroanthus impetiginosus]|uniref:Salicylate carboxymethyltransferase n=1 Tax=Handroanthus impetiginosus TaxID=429701 RepID=A0A2G9HE47_9LAMI|nr:Salicylate carboxymethyltransferase [Handroanthus impetiginosus]